MVSSTRLFQMPTARKKASARSCESAISQRTVVAQPDASQKLRRSTSSALPSQTMRYQPCSG